MRPVRMIISGTMPKLIQAVLRSPRAGYVLGALSCAGLLLFALYLQYYEYEDPCPLCIFQRVAYVSLLVVFAAAAVQGPRRAGALAYGVLLVVIALIGGGIAARQVWLQHLPKEMVPACGPGLNYMLDKFPLFQALGKVLRGSGECAEVGWTFIGFSIAEWSLLWFVLFAALAVGMACAARRRARPA